LLWSLGLLLSSVPLLPWTEEWQLYSQSSICLPLPITRRQWPGYHYTLGVMIVLNMMLFLLIAAGQSAVYLAILSNTINTSLTTDASRQTRQNMNIARRLIAVALSNFLCWFPVGVMGTLAAQGL
jgi:hypothetical protein